MNCEVYFCWLGVQFSSCMKYILLNLNIFDIEIFHLFIVIIEL